MKGQFFKLQCAAVIVTAAFVSARVVSFSANAQGRHGGGGGSSSSGSSRSSSSSTRSSSSSSSSRGSSSRSSGSSSGPSRSSGNSSRSSSSSSTPSTSSSSSSNSSASGSGRTWGHWHENRDNSARSGKRDKGNGEGTSGGSGSPGSRPNTGERNRTGDSTRTLTNSTTNDRARLDDPEGRRGSGRGRDRDRERDRSKFGPATRYRGGDRSEWHRHECERGRYYYPTTFYYASNYDNYGYGPTAYDHGYEDGLFTGANDAWRGQTYDPERSHFYKHGAGGFLSIFGGPAWYRAAYRDGFMRGYEEGFQNYSSYIVDGRFRR